MYRGAALLHRMLVERLEKLVNNLSSARFKAMIAVVPVQEQERPYHPSSNRLDYVPSSWVDRADLQREGTALLASLFRGANEFCQEYVLVHEPMWFRELMTFAETVVS